MFVALRLKAGISPGWAVVTTTTGRDPKFKFSSKPTSARPSHGSGGESESDSQALTDPGAVPSMNPRAFKQTRFPPITAGLEPALQPTARADAGASRAASTTRIAAAPSSERISVRNQPTIPRPNWPSQPGALAKVAGSDRPAPASLRRKEKPGSSEADRRRHKRRGRPKRGFLFGSIKEADAGTRTPDPFITRY